MPYLLAWFIIPSRITKGTTIPYPVHGLPPH